MIRQQNNKWLYITSHNRDRTQWPSVGEFDVSFDSSQSVSPLSAVDPVSHAAPQIAWTGNTFVDTGGATINLVIAAIINVGAAGDQVNITASGASLQQAQGYYIGSVLRSAFADRRIVDYYYMGNNIGQFVLISALPDTVIAGTAVSITDPTSFADLNIAQIFVPSSSIPVQLIQSWVGYLIYNETRDMYTTILSFDTTLRLAKCVNMIGWLATDNFSIRQIPPVQILIVLASTLTSLVVGNSSSPVIPGDYCRIQGALYGTGKVAPTGDMRRITSSTQLTATTWSLNIFPAWSALPPIGSDVEELGFTRDNFKSSNVPGPLPYGQSHIVTLESISIPSTVLAGVALQQFASWPFISVEISDPSSGSLGTNSLPGMTKSSNGIVFLVPIHTEFGALTGTGNARPGFLHLSASMTQQVPFSLQSSLHIAVRLPTGQIITPQLIDNSAPLEPNPLLQISILIGYRLSN
jgi:hypothetical protein